MSYIWLVGVVGGFELAGFLAGTGHFWLGLVLIIPAAFCLAKFKKTKT